jgi:hypothetical protein
VENANPVPTLGGPSHAHSAPALLVTSTILAAGAATAAEGGRLPAACFNAARDFGRALPADVPALRERITAPAPQVQQATAMRSQGIEACLTGRTKEGVGMIRHATAMLKG